MPASAFSGRRRPATPLLALLAALATAPARAQALDRSRFEELVATIGQDHEAPWRTIPWRIDLLAAQREAARDHRPLFVWAMDGHPLGCT